MQLVDLDTFADRLGCSRRSVTRWVGDGLPLAEPDGSRKRVDLVTAWVWAFGRGLTKIQPPATPAPAAAAPEELSPDDAALLAALLEGAAPGGQRVLELADRVPRARLQKLQDLGKARTEAAKAHAAELALAKARGDVLSREEFTRGDLARCQLIKTTLLELADRLAPRLANKDETTVRAAIDAEVRVALGALAREWPGP